MPKRTVPDLADRLAETTGLTDSNLRTSARRLREANMLSQYGQGRGAAAATAEDAATILLVGATEFPPLHAVIVGWALWACRPMIDIDYEDEEIPPDVLARAEPFKVDGDFVRNPILLAGALIGNRTKIREIRIWMARGLSVLFVEKDGGGEITYSLRLGGSVSSAFEEKLGGRLGLQRSHIIDGRVLIEIADWLGLPEQAEETVAA